MSLSSLSRLMEGEFVKFVLADGGGDTSLTLSWLVEGEISNMVSIEHTLYLKISNIAKRILWRARLILPAPFFNCLILSTNFGQPKT